MENLDYQWGGLIKFVSGQNENVTFVEDWCYSFIAGGVAFLGLLLKRAAGYAAFSWEFLIGAQCPKITILLGCQSGKFGPQEDDESGKCGMN